MTINILPDEIINQIAAGEVIENPAAVIKELIENSIDAGSNNIEVEIEEYGLKKILIRDNGCGISREDLLKAPLRHSTSKIKNFNDLYNIKTMGFRGEALASIFSISNAKIISRQEGEDEAFEILSDDILKTNLSASGVGTTIVVENLFYNTPARKKYLRSENLELKAILDVINRFVVFYSDIKFSLKHNSRMLINKPQFKNKIDNIYYTLGKDLRDNLLEIDDKIKGISINGYIGKPSNISYPIRKNQYMYVNSRYIKSKVIRDAIYAGFSTNLMEARHPFFVLDIQIDPEIVDVNIHPTKIEVKFENELEVYEFVRNAIKKVFLQNETFKPFEERKEKNLDLSSQIKDLPELKKSIKIEPKNYFSKEFQKSLQVNERPLEYNSYETKSEEILDNFDEKLESEKVVAYGPLFDILKEYKIVGQLNKTYIILEIPDRMIIVDQHAAEEKFNYEMFREQLENKVSTQKLLKSEIIDLSSSQMLLYRENLDLLKKLGFKTEEFGSNQIKVLEVPINLRKNTLDPQIIKYILEEVSVDRKFKSLENDKLEKLASMSCRKSIKAGYEMTSLEIHNLIEQLKRLKEPFNCPHGRPVLLEYSFLDLEKKFKRIV